MLLYRNLSSNILNVLVSDQLTPRNRFAGVFMPCCLFSTKISDPKLTPPQLFVEIINGGDIDIRFEQNGSNLGWWRVLVFKRWWVKPYIGCFGQWLVWARRRLRWRRDWDFMRLGFLQAEPQRLAESHRWNRTKKKSVFQVLFSCVRSGWFEKFDFLFFFALFKDYLLLLFFWFGLLLYSLLLPLEWCWVSFLTFFVFTMFTVCCALLEKERKGKTEREREKGFGIWDMGYGS